MWEEGGKSVANGGFVGNVYLLLGGWSGFFGFFRIFELPVAPRVMSADGRVRCTARPGERGKITVEISSFSLHPKQRMLRADCKTDKGDGDFPRSCFLLGKKVCDGLFPGRIFRHSFRRTAAGPDRRYFSLWCRSIGR